ncbi:MAG TPA: aminotransferase class V-fold PLP-dependent enzyme [Rhabdochlamydiaceae bacterium]|nr:aminotransferase class V-fold PLP-dependent enzyme [Rhabdochlamydiaceae bacterium]
MAKKKYSPLDIAQKKKELLCAFSADEKSHLFLTASSAESDFQVVFSTYRDFIQQTGRTHLLFLESEEETILGPIKSLERFGIHGKMLPTNEHGQLTKGILEEAIKPRSAMLSLSWANSLTGVIHPIWDIMEVCKQKEVKLHLNLNSVIGKLYFSLQDIEADFFTCNGAIIAKEAFTPAFEDKSYDPMEKLNGLYSDLINARDQMDHLCTETARLRDKLESGIQEICSDSQILFKNVHRLPHIAVIDFPGVSAEALLYLLYYQGIDAKRAGQSTISFELCAQTTEKEIDCMVEAACSLAKKLQTYSEQLC